MRSKYVTKLIPLFVVALLSAGVSACSGPDSGNSETATSQAGVGGPSDAQPAGSAATNDPQAIGTAPVMVDPTVPSTTAGGEPSTTPADPSTSTSEAVPPATVMATTAPGPTQMAVQPGALLPNNRIVSYYGHPNSASMGILGEYSMEEARSRLAEQAAEFERADPSRPVVLAFELIATVAQPNPGDDGTYVAYTGDEIIQEYVDFVTANNMILILDLQIGLDTIPNQINLIRRWLELPNVHLAIDPEFSMKANEVVPRDRIPGEFIGEVNGLDVQQGLEMVARIVAEKGLPPKVVIVHQFEDDMIFNKDKITPVPGVQFVLDMDGFGGVEAKVGNYGRFVRDQLIQFGGIKLFYRQDDPLLTPAEIVALDPPALVVIYQ